MSEIKEYKSGELSQALGITSNTLRSWADMYEGLLSEGATAAKRTYTPDDALLLATVAEFREHGKSFEAIREVLQNGQRIETMPSIPTQQEAIVKRQEGIVLQSQYEGLQASFKELEQYKNYLESELAETKEALESTQSDKVELTARVNQLEGDLKATNRELEIIRQERKSSEYWIDRMNRERMVAIMIGLAMVIVIGLLVGSFLLLNQ